MVNPSQQDSSRSGSRQSQRVRQAKPQLADDHAHAQRANGFANKGVQEGFYHQHERPASTHTPDHGQPRPPYSPAANSTHERRPTSLLYISNTAVASLLHRQRAHNSRPEGGRTQKGGGAAAARAVARAWHMPDRQAGQACYAVSCCSSEQGSRHSQQAAQAASINAVCWRGCQCAPQRAPLLQTYLTEVLPCTSKCMPLRQIWGGLRTAALRGSVAAVWSLCMNQQDKKTNSTQRGAKQPRPLSSQDQSAAASSATALSEKQQSDAFPKSQPSK